MLKISQISYQYIGKMEKYDIKYDYQENGFVNAADKAAFLASWIKTKTIEEIK